MLLIIVAPIAGIALLAMLGGAVGSFEGNRRAAGWGYMAAAGAILLAFGQLGVFMGYWALPAWMPHPAWSADTSTAATEPARAASIEVLSATPEQLAGDLRTKVQQLQQKRDTLARLLADLQKEKTETIDALKKEATSIAGIKDNPAAQLRAKRLRDLVQKIDGFEKKKADYELALYRGQTVLRDLERQLTLKAAGIGDDELEQVSLTLRLVDAKLRGDFDITPLASVEVEAVLRKELGWQD
jgi:hypothetical protein